MTDEKEAKRSLKSEQIQSNARRISKIEDNIDYAKFEIQEQRISELDKSREATGHALGNAAGDIVELRNHQKNTDILIREYEQTHNHQLNELKDWNKQLYEDYNACYMNATRKNTEVLRELKKIVLELFDAHHGEFEEKWTEEMREKLDGKKEPMILEGPKGKRVIIHTKSIPYIDVKREDLQRWKKEFEKIGHPEWEYIEEEYDIQ